MEGICRQHLDRLQIFLEGEWSSILLPSVVSLFAKARKLLSFLLAE
jgi:hypothetical protein